MSYLDPSQDKFYRERMLEFMVNTARYNIRTHHYQDFLNNKPIFRRIYQVPILFHADDISPVVTTYISNVQKIVEFQKSKQFLNHPVAKYFLR